MYHVMIATLEFLDLRHDKNKCLLYYGDGRYKTTNAKQVVTDEKENHCIDNFLNSMM